MKRNIYNDGLAIGAATILAVMYSCFAGKALPECLSIGVCAGFLLDCIVKKVCALIAKR